MVKVITLLISALFLSSCGAPLVKQDRFISGSEAGDFFLSQSNDKSLATLFLQCGKQTQDNIMFGKIENELANCQFNIDGIDYEPIEKGMVAKVQLSPGKHSLAQSSQMLATTIPTSIDLRPSDTLLATAEYLFVVKFTGHQHILTVRVDNDEHVINRVKGKKPVKISVSK